jgi:hypothetical protein
MKIETIMFSDRNPIVSLTRMVQDGPGFRFQRGVAFVYKNVSRRIKVLATCRHHFIKFPFEEFEFSLGMGNKILRPVSPAIIPDSGEDIAFIVVEDSSRTKCLELNKIKDLKKVQKGKNLFNVKNDVGDINSRDNLFVMRQKFKHLSHYMVLDAVENEQGDTFDSSLEMHQQKIEQAKSKNMIIYPTVCMISRPGCSGSPIFDDDFNLCGINLRGRDDIDMLGYLPSSEVERYYRQLEAEIQGYL